MAGFWQKLGWAVRAEKENNSDKAGRDKPTATYAN